MLCCPHCEKDVESRFLHCPFCGKPLHDETAKQIYKQRVAQRIQENRELNKRSARLQLIWLIIFAVVITGVFFWKN